MITRKILSVLVLALGAVAATPAAAQSSTEARFVGTDGDWFNARNWSTGRVPGAANDVVLPAGAQVVMHTRDEHVALGGRLVHRGSGSEGGNLVFDPNPACTGDPFGCAVGPLSGARHHAGEPHADGRGRLEPRGRPWPLRHAER